jgi:integrase/recombinase XerD
MFEDYEKYLDFIKVGQNSEHTIRAYESALNRFVQFFTLDSSESLNKLNSDDLRRYQKSLSESGLSESSVNSHFRYIHIFTNWMLANHKIVNNPFDGIKSLKEGEKDVAVFFTIEERDAMLKACNNPMKKLMLAVMFFCGLRREEITTILVSDFNPDDNSLIIHGKNSKQEKQESINPYVVKLYLKYMKTRKSNSPYLFSSQKMGFGRENTGWHKLTGKTILNIVRSAALKAGIAPEKVAKAGAHTTRRSCACHLALMGMNDFEIQAHMRHNQISTTQRYVKPARNMLAEKAVMSLPMPKGT